MVDIIKFLPPGPTHRLQNGSLSEPITLPIFVSTNIPQNDRTSIINNTKRWIGRCPGDPPRQLNISDAPYSLHRKVIYRELGRYYPATTVDVSVPIKTKQQQQTQKNSNREPLKVTTVTSIPVLSCNETNSSRLFDALSQHVLIKAEPLRPANNFLNTTSSTLSSWQKYWSSTQTQRRRKEANDSEAVLYRVKRDQPLIATPRIITNRDPTFFTTSNYDINIRTPSSAASSCTPTKLISSRIFDEQSSFLKEEDLFSLSPLVSLYVFDSSLEKTPPMSVLKPMEDKPVSSIQNESTVVTDNTEVSNSITTITRKIYKLPLPSNKPKVHKTASKRESRSKSFDKKPVILPAFLEKKETKNTSVPKRKRQIPPNQILPNKPHRTTTTKKQQQSLPTVITGTKSNSKYQRPKWDEPYVGVRFDPPTPPSSPSLFVWPQDSDQDESDSRFGENITNEAYL